MKKYIYLILIAVFIFCSFNIFGQDFKIGMSESKDSISKYIGESDRELENILSKLQFQLESTDIYLNNQIEIFFLSQKYNSCGNGIRERQMLDYISYLQEKYWKQGDEVSNFLESLEVRFISEFENTIDHVIKEVALENDLDAIIDKAYVPIQDDKLEDWTLQIYLRSAKIVAQMDLEEITGFTLLIEKLETDWRIAMSKSWKDFPYKTNE